jgi:pimeloyl-ACP methyl ester carboxylesterase
MPPLVSALLAVHWRGLDRTRARCRVAGGTRPERQSNIASATGKTIMRSHSAVSFMSLFLLAMLLGFGPVITGRAREGTPEATPTALAWSTCADGSGWECAALPVPLDYADATGPTIDIALTRLPATDPARRIGSLVVNCGGPGCPTVAILHQLGTVLFPVETRARFDLVGFDPRGVGESGQIDCRHDYDAYYAIDPSPDDVAEWEAWLAGGRAFAESCAANAGNLLPFLGTENVVSDMERLREALGEETISFLGISYGTSVGARYADRYPDRVRAFALDSALPAVVDTATFVPEWVDAIERAFDAYLADCAAAVTCAFHADGGPAACPGRRSGLGSAPPLPRPLAATVRRCSPWPINATSDLLTAAMDLATRCSLLLAASMLISPRARTPTRRWPPRPRRSLPASAPTMRRGPCPVSSGRRRPPQLLAHP